MIQEARLEDLKEVVDIVMKYRHFYGVETQTEAEVEDFMRCRIKNGQSKVFISKDKENGAIGFIQLYPSYSTVSLKPQWILNDFYVEEEYRNKGYGTELMNYVKQYFKGSAKGFILVTDKDNSTAKAFYDKNGWNTGEYDFYTFFYK